MQIDIQQQTSQNQEIKVRFPNINVAGNIKLADLTKRKSERAVRPWLIKPRRPFWLSGANFYALSVALGIAIFFISWGILHENGDEMPWITSGIAFSIWLVGAVLLRETVLRRMRIRYLAQERRFDLQMNEIQLKTGELRRQHKFSLERNEQILHEIKQKSDAAKVLGKFSAAHHEVFELCDQYLVISAKELQSVDVRSPRLPAIRRGQTVVEKLERYHLLQWAQIEIHAFTQAANVAAKTTDKIVAMQNAISIVDSALRTASNERKLSETRYALTEMLTSIRVSHFVERAERCVFKLENREAIGHYRDALFYLSRDNVDNSDRRMAAQKINAEIERIRHLIETVGRN